MHLFQILYAKDIDQRSSTFEKALAVGQDYQRRTKALLLRAAVLKNQIHVKVSFEKKRMLFAIDNLEWAWYVDKGKRDFLIDENDSSIGFKTATEGAFNLFQN